MLTPARLTNAGTVLLIILLLMLPSRASGECIGTDRPFRNSRHALVFAGTLIKREVVSRFDPKAQDPVRVAVEEQQRYLDTDLAIGMRLTFDVREVWRGPTRRTLIVYQILNPDSVRSWKEEVTYVIAANSLTEDRRSRILRLDGDEDDYLISDCSTYSYTGAIEKHLRRAFGRARKPE